MRSATGKLDGYPPPLFFMFGTIALLAVAGDLRMMRAGGLQGSRRIARHLWRMCFALFIAAGSFFLVTKRPIGLIRGLLRILGLAGHFPQALRIPSLFIIPAVLPILAMVYWLWRVRVRPPSVGSRTGPRQFDAAVVCAPLVGVVRLDRSREPEALRQQA